MSIKVLKIQILISVFLCVSCASTTVVEYKTIKIPVRCEVVIPNRPIWKNLNETLADYIQYSEMLRIRLEECTGEIK